MTADTWDDHPAPYSMYLFPYFVEALQGCKTVLDPMAGTGRIHLLRDMMDIETYGIEIEPEGANMHPDTICADSTAIPYEDGKFDAICVSPVYHNRMSDHHDAKERCRICNGTGKAEGETCEKCKGEGFRSYDRRTYRHTRRSKAPLHENNAGRYQWNDKARHIDSLILSESVRVLRDGGTFVLNIKNHIKTVIRGGVKTQELQDVAGWFRATLESLGCELQATTAVPAPGMRKGANRDVRDDVEYVMVFKKKEAA